MDQPLKHAQGELVMLAGLFPEQMTMPAQANANRAKIPDIEGVRPIWNQSNCRVSAPPERRIGANEISEAVQHG
jgi:hypothetical protein